MVEMLTAPRVLDGVAISNEIKAELAETVGSMTAAGHQPGLAVVLVGDHAPSEIYVRNKVRTCGELGLHSELHRPSADSSTGELIALVHRLNADRRIDGILVQLPLPPGVETNLVLAAIDPQKDVDGLHPLNAGLLLQGAPMDTVLAPCTPSGILEMLERSEIRLPGTRAVMIGKSNLVGKPMAVLLMNAQCTVSVCNRFTQDLPAFTREAELLIVAIGRPGYITAGMIRPGATVIDVGINRLTDEAEVLRFFPPGSPDHIRRMEGFRQRGSTVIGDVDPRAFAASGAYSPVPGGVGALTIATLMSNTVKAARLRRGL